MAVPRNRSSNARKNNRRSHHAKTAKQQAICSLCKGASLPHRLCTHCNCYKRKEAYYSLEKKKKVED